MPLEPRLAKLFEDFEQAELGFLEKLSVEDQADLAALINRRIDKEGGPLFQTMAVASGVLPNFLKIKMAQDMLGPRMVAKMTSYIPAKQAVQIARGMKTEFLAEVAVHQEPEKVVEVVEGSPDDLLLKISRVLASRGNYEVLASFADHISPAKLKLLGEKLGDLHALVEVANHMKSADRMIETAVQFSDSHLLQLMKSISDLEYYELAARVGQRLDVNRQVNMLNELENAEAARLAAHYDPEIVAKIVGQVEVEEVVNIALLMQPEVLGKLFNFLPIETINKVIPYLDSEIILKSLPHVNMKKIENNWQSLSGQVEGMLSKLAEQYDPLKALMKGLGL